jgi:hypothetical protein
VILGEEMQQQEQIRNELNFKVSQQELWLWVQLPVYLGSNSTA